MILTSKKKLLSLVCLLFSLILLLIIGLSIVGSQKVYGQTANGYSKIGIGFVNSGGTEPTVEPPGGDNPGMNTEAGRSVGQYAKGDRNFKKYPQTGSSNGWSRILQFYGLGFLTLFIYLFLHCKRQEEENEK